MKFKEWNEIAELIGIAAVVGSLIFVGLQMRQAQDIANAERRMMDLANSYEMHNAINEHADIWLRGLTDEELSDVETVIFENLVVDRHQYAFLRVLTANALGADEAAASTAAEYAAFLHENPSARRVLEAREAWLDKYRTILIPEWNGRLANVWRATVDRHLRTLDELRQ